MAESADSHDKVGLDDIMFSALYDFLIRLSPCVNPTLPPHEAMVRVASTFGHLEFEVFSEVASKCHARVMYFVKNVIEKILSKYGKHPSDKTATAFVDCLLASKACPEDRGNGNVAFGTREFCCKGQFSLLRSIWLLANTGILISDSLAQFEVDPNGDVHSQVHPPLKQALQHIETVLPSALDELSAFAASN